MVHPEPGYRTFETSVFLVGAVSVGNGLKMEVNQGEPFSVDATASGYFSQQIDLIDGENMLLLQEVDQGDHVLETLSLEIIRERPKAVLSKKILDVELESVTLQGTVIVQPGEEITMGFQATPGAQVSVQVPGFSDVPAAFQEQQHLAFIDNRRTIFAQLHQTTHRIPGKGYYQGSFTVPSLMAELMPTNLTVPVTALVSDGEEAQSIDLPATITVWEGARKATLTATNPDGRIVCRTGPGDHFARLTPQCNGVPVWVDGLQHGYYRLRFSQNRIVWVEKKSVCFTSFEPQSNPLPVSTAVLPLIEVQTDSANKSTLRLPLNHPVPLEIQVAEQTLTLTLFDTVSGCDFIREAMGASPICHVGWQQTDPTTVELTVDLQDASAGYDYGFDDSGFWLQVKTLSANPMDTVILLDPGHGGEETGTKGPSGLPEKDLNLTVAMLFQEALQAAGFANVHLTRTDDSEVSLFDRQATAQKTEADLILSLHHNALPDGRDPQAVQGASCYYYHSFSKPLARKLQQALVTDAGCPDYGLFYDSLFLPRIHMGVSVLIELGFFTHPDEFERLCDPAFQKQAVSALVVGLKRYLSI